MIKQEDSHQHYQAADNCHGKVGGGSAQSLLFLIMRYPHIGGERHDFEENKHGVKIRREEDTLRRAQSKQQKQVVSVAVMVMT